MIARIVVALLLLLPNLAWAQQQPSPNREAAALAYRQLGLALGQVLNEPVVDPGEIAKLRARITELEEKCGDKCKDANSTGPR